jgi:hypothetical protein
MAGGGSFSSDQQVSKLAVDGQLVPATQRARVTYIQACGVAGGNVKLYNGTGTGGTLVAEFEFDVDGLSVYVPGSGILFDAGVYLDLTATPGVTIIYT